MKLKNYTSEVPVTNSINRIEKRLVDMGATSVVKEYSPEKKIIGITFCIPFKGQTVPFRMPAQVDKVFAVFWKEVRNPDRVSKTRYMEQAERTAWKNVAEWVDIQSSLIMMEQVELMQVLLPYALDPRTGKTIYEKFTENPQRMLD